MGQGSRTNSETGRRSERLLKDEYRKMVGPGIWVVAMIIDPSNFSAVKIDQEFLENEKRAMPGQSIITMNGEGLSDPCEAYFIKNGSPLNKLSQMTSSWSVGCAVNGRTIITCVYTYSMKQLVLVLPNSLLNIEDEFFLLRRSRYIKDHTDCEFHQNRGCSLLTFGSKLTNAPHQLGAGDIYFSYESCISIRDAPIIRFAHGRGIYPPGCGSQIFPVLPFSPHSHLNEDYFILRDPVRSEGNERAQNKLFILVESIRTLTSSDFSETSHMLNYDNGGTNTAYFRSEKFLVR
eukprot:sb/3467609/